MAALEDKFSEARLLLRELVHESVPVSECLSDLHADFSLGLLLGIECSIVQDELLVLEEHRDSQVLDGLSQVLQK